MAAPVPAKPAVAVPQPLPKPPTDNLTILLFGSTGSGKTAQIGELAEHYYATQKKRTRLYTADKGGYITIKPYITLGIVDPIPMFGDPWVWIDHAVKGDKWVNDKWVPGVDADIAMYAFEGMTSFADSVMHWMREAASRGVNIGGGGSFSFEAGNQQEGKIKVGSNNMAHYQVAQGQVYEKSTQSQYLPGTVLWTAGDSRGEDDAVGTVVGPQIAGKAMTGEAPRWFKYTFRIATEVLPGMPTKHVLHLDRHIEMAAKGAAAIANGRVPLAGAEQVPIGAKIEPASLVKALELLEKRTEAATDVIAKRLGIVRK